MSLSKRALFVIFPAIFLSYCLAAYTVYVSLENSVRQLERNSVDLEVTELAFAFNEYTTFAESYLQALLENKSLTAFYHDEKDVYRNVALSASIERTIRSFKQHQSEKLSFLLVDIGKNNKEIFFFELSDDPFSELGDELRQEYLRTIADGEVESWNYIEAGSGTDSIQQDSFIVINRLIDKSTSGEPVAGHFDNSVLAQFALQPTLFLKKWNKLKRRYDAAISVDKQPKPRQFDFIVTRTLGSDKALYVGIPESYIDGKLVSVRLTLIGLTFLFFVISSLLIYHLVRKYITKPIVSLESELTDVIEGRRDNIDIEDVSNDEVGSLKSTFGRLYGDLSQSFKHTKKLAETDHLTGVFNLSYLTVWARTAIARAKEQAHVISVILIDLDHFKFVNDRHGINAGDALLKSMASALKNIESSIVAEGGTKLDRACVGRVSGDEFALVVVHYDAPEIVASAISKIENIFQNDFLYDGRAIPVSLSLGVASYPKDAKNLSELVANVNTAVTLSKQTESTSCSFYSESLTKFIRRKQDVAQALKDMKPDDEFFLVYMPLVNALTRKVEGFEVLLRWISPTLGFVGPDEFVPIAEERGWFKKIDEWVVRNSIASYHLLWQKLGYDFKLSINLSSAQLNENQIIETLIDSVKRSGIDAKNIQLEMTETLNVEYTQKADALLNVLRDLGFQIAIDDFGTGYTALLQLVEYPAQMIKFDKSFMEKAMMGENRQMLGPLVELCHSQGLKVTVEGVETKEIADYLQSIGCDYLQGYYFGKPAKLNELTLDFN